MQLDYNNVNELLFRLLDNEISDSDFAKLTDWLNSSREAKLYYYRFMGDCSALSLRKLTTIAENLQDSQFDILPVDYSNASLRGVDLEEFMADVDRDESQDSGLTQDMLEILEMERTSFAVEVPKEEIAEEEAGPVVVRPARVNKRVSKFQIFTLVMSAAAMLFVALLLMFSPEPVPSVEVATLSDQMNVQWGPSGKPESGERLLTNGWPLDLKKGIVSIDYDDGVEVVIEGPALFEIQRSGIYLEYGRLYSKVSEAGLGFIVKTPTLQFVDQGTEFGVLADINGSSELHVTKGKVQLFAGLNGNMRI